MSWCVQWRGTGAEFYSVWHDIDGEEFQLKEHAELRKTAFDGVQGHAIDRP